MNPGLPRPERPLVTAAVLTYNGRELLETALPSLAAQTFTDFKTVVVDNGSSDDTVEWLKANWPDVEIVALPSNVGVTRALNVCLEAAVGEFVCLLNNDIEMEPDCVAELVRALQEHPEAGSACAKLIDFYDRSVIDGAGDIYVWSGAANRRGQGERDSGQYDQPQPIFGACGGAALYRATAITTVGPFDEQMFAIYEDVDWSFRAQLAGFACRYVPSAVVYHMGSATIGKGFTDFALYQNWRNGIWVVIKNYPPTALVRHGHRLLARQLGNLAYSLYRRRMGVWLRVWRDALKGLPQMLRKRVAVQRARKVATADLNAVIDTSFRPK